MRHYVVYDAYMRQESQKYYSESLRSTTHALGQRIARARKARRLTLIALQARCGIHRTTLSRLESGDPGVTLGVFMTVLESLNLLSDIELLLSRPEETLPRRTSAAPILKRDF
jgi:transcriptional regulator with XRE-family HTH domain